MVLCVFLYFFSKPGLLVASMCLVTEEGAKSRLKTYLQWIE